MFSLQAHCGSRLWQSEQAKEWLLPGSHFSILMTLLLQDCADWFVICHSGKGTTVEELLPWAYLWSIFLIDD